MNVLLYKNKYVVLIVDKASFQLYMTFNFHKLAKE